MSGAQPNQIIWFILVVTTTVVTLAITMVGLSMGIHEVFPLLYLFPVVLVAYRYPGCGVAFSLFLGSVYLGLVFLFGLNDLIFLSLSTAWFYVVVSVGVVMSSISQGMRREERKYWSIFNGSQTGLIVVDREQMRVEEANITGARMLGYMPRELRGTSLVDIWPDKEQSLKILKRVNPLFSLAETDVRFRDKQGSIHTVLLSASSLDGDRIILSFIDVTDRRAIEEALLDSEVKFRNLVEKSLCGVYMIQDGRFVYVNPTFASMHGHTVGSLMRDILPGDLIHDDDRGKFAEISNMYMRKEAGPFHYEIRHVRSDGETIFVETIESIVDYHGRPAVMGTAIDITESRRNRNALRCANEKLNLLGEVTRHDLLNQMTAAMGFIELATEESNGGQAGEYLSKATSVMKRMYKLLQFTKDYQNLGVDTPRWMDAHQTFMRAASAFSSPDLAYSVLLHNLQLYADPLLEKVFYNLIDNSLRHGGQVKRIEFRYEETGEGLVLIYKDDGTGIPPERKEEIFRRSTSPENGYGLFLCRQILMLTDMKIRETGEFGRGARFEIFVPRGNYRFMETEGSTTKPVLEANI